MTLFDRYIAVDWSANNGPKSGPDSIWIAEAVAAYGGITLLPSQNPRTRTEAMDWLTERLSIARSQGQRLVVGFDFPFGYPAGATERISGKADWRSLWSYLADHVEDDAINRSNRFEVAAEINRGVAGDMWYWGHPNGHSYEGLHPGKTNVRYGKVAEKRIVERRSNAKSVWQLNGNGSVGGQALLGIPRVGRLRNDPRFECAVWPFETDFERDLSAPVVLAEIYPSIWTPDPGITPKDRAQVEAVVCAFADLDRRDRLREVLSAPSDISAADREIAVREEGWIVGQGHEALIAGSAIRPQSAKAPPASYLRDGNAIYAESFATIARETDLSAVPLPLHQVITRMIHASGMVDLVEDFRGDAAVVDAVRRALANDRPVICDVEMVKAGIIARFLPKGTRVIAAVAGPDVGAIAGTMGTTRSAAGMAAIEQLLHGAVVVIGNAPTALFQLIEMLEAGARRPSAIIATPVGFVGAAESKALLVEQNFGIPYVTILGRRGGSAMASAAFNAITKDIAS